MTDDHGPGGPTMSAPPPPPPPPSAPLGPNARLLRRSREDRIGAGVAGGLGRYFNVDPVLFRVLFAVSAFFGGAGILAYLLAWAAIPDENTGAAAIDRWVRGLRQRRVPVWAVVIGAALVFWLAAFSWWAPGPFFPVMVVVIVLVAVFGRRDRSSGPPSGAVGYPGAPPSYPPPSFGGPYSTTPASTPVYRGEPGTAVPAVAEGESEEAGEPADPEATHALPVTDPSAAGAYGGATPGFTATTSAAPPQWVQDSRQWMSESRSASRERRRRALPLRIGTLVAVIVTLTILGIADAITGIAFPAYFWATFAITGVGLLAGLVLRRTPWSMALLLVPAVLGLIAFGGTRASLHDGTGDRTWTPTTHLDSSYRLGFGQGTLDLQQLTGPGRDVQVRMAAGRVDIIVPRSMPVAVAANVHWGQIVVDGTDVYDHDGNGGYNVHRTIAAPSGSTGTPFTITVDLADGEINVQHV